MTKPVKPTFIERKLDPVKLLGVGWRRTRFTDANDLMVGLTPLPLPSFELMGVAVLLRA